MFVENFQVFQNMFVYAKILQPTKVQSWDKKSVSEKPRVASRWTWRQTFRRKKAVNKNCYKYKLPLKVLNLMISLFRDILIWHTEWICGNKKQ